MGKIAAVVLAAGGSSRMGQPKQLLSMEDGCSLVRKAAETALTSSCDVVYVVVGSACEAVEQALSGVEVSVVRNTDWRSGISGSIRRGLQRVCRDHRDIDAVLVAVVDQPAVDAVVLDGLINAFRDGAQLVASEYADTVGVPALFSRKYFDALEELAGDRGAKTILLRYAGDVVTLPFAGGESDIDTPEDLEKVG